MGEHLGWKLLSDRPKPLAPRLRVPAEAAAEQAEKRQELEAREKKLKTQRNELEEDGKTPEA